MLDLTAAETGRLWSLGSSAGDVTGTATVGGAVLDLGKTLFTMPLLAYGLVFALQALV